LILVVTISLLEVVLSPAIPNNSHFLLRFRLRNVSAIKEYGTSRDIGASISPLEVPSPSPTHSGLDMKQISMLQQKLHKYAHSSQYKHRRDSTGTKPITHVLREVASDEHHIDSVAETVPENKLASLGNQPMKINDTSNQDADPSSQDLVNGKLSDILLLLAANQKPSKENGEKPIHDSHYYELNYIVFLISNYLVLFLVMVAVSAEVQVRLPVWMPWMEAQVQNVQNCAKDKDTLFHCISNGDLAGLVASVLLWLSRSFSNRNVFFFGFESTKQVWNVVYESFITSCCWGISYLLFQRGMNPDTRHRFLQKYWKDALYGSLAGFYAAFLKQILKNLIPKEVVEDVWRDRHFSIISWIQSFE
jgi:hypothetical protein